MQGIDSIFSIVARGDREGILRVIRNNQDLNEKNNIGQNLIEVAVESGLYHMAVLLRKHGANIDTKRKSDGSGLLHLACYLGHFQIVEWLVEECKLDVEAVNNMGFKPIHLCIARDRMFVAKYLIDNGALYDAEFGYSALHIAAFMGRHKIGSFLISLGVSLDRQNPQGITLRLII